MTKTQPAAEITPLAAQLSGWSPGSRERSIRRLGSRPGREVGCLDARAITDPTGELRAPATAEFRRGSDRP